LTPTILTSPRFQNNEDTLDRREGAARTPVISAACPPPPGNDTEPKHEVSRGLATVKPKRRTDSKDGAPSFFIARLEPPSGSRVKIHRSPFFAQGLPLLQSPRSAAATIGEVGGRLRGFPHIAPVAEGELVAGPSLGVALREVEPSAAGPTAAAFRVVLADEPEAALGVNTERSCTSREFLE